MKSKKIYIIIGIVAVITISAYFFFKSKPETVLDPLPDPSNKGGSKTPEKTVPNFGYPIVNGMQGDIIKRIQKGLNMAFDAGVKVDGIWGKETTGALLKYLQRYQITSQADATAILKTLNEKTIQNNK
jgi:hypothetical protein